VHRSLFQLATAAAPLVLVLVSNGTNSIDIVYLLSAGGNLATVVRNFTGFGREIFTDTGKRNSNDPPAFLTPVRSSTTFFL
jgi:hypothetical protein